MALRFEAKMFGWQSVLPATPSAEIPVTLADNKQFFSVPNMSLVQPRTVTKLKPGKHTIAAERDRAGEVIAPRPTE
jgi:hypothetical protein